MSLIHLTEEEYERVVESLHSLHDTGGYQLAVQVLEDIVEKYEDVIYPCDWLNEEDE